MIFLGSKSGRNSDKMKEVKLTEIATPSGNMTFQKARLLIECNLTQITTSNFPDDFYYEDAIEYMSQPYKDPKDHSKYVFGEIMAVWAKR